LDELSSHLHKHKIPIACLQETTPNSVGLPASFPDNPIQGYTFIHKGRQGKAGGGLAFLIQEDVSYHPRKVSDLIPTGDETIEIDGINVDWNGSKVDIFNVYIPPPDHARPTIPLTSPNSSHPPKTPLSSATLMPTIPPGIPTLLAPMLSKEERLCLRR
jgi:exonuclease III